MAAMILTGSAGEAHDWREAVCLAAEALHTLGAVESTYGQRCIDSAEQFGPYIVLSKGVALAHARPEDDCLQAGLSLFRVKSPVNFGHPKNDPVDLVFCLASADGEEHINSTKHFASALRQGLATRLRAAGSEDLTSILEEALAHE